MALSTSLSRSWTPTVCLIPAHPFPFFLLTSLRMPLVRLTDVYIHDSFDTHTHLPHTHTAGLRTTPLTHHALALSHLNSSSPDIRSHSTKVHRSDTERDGEWGGERKGEHESLSSSGHGWRDAGWKGGVAPSPGQQERGVSVTGESIAWSRDDLLKLHNKKLGFLNPAAHALLPHHQMVSPDVSRAWENTHTYTQIFHHGAPTRNVYAQTHGGKGEGGRRREDPLIQQQEYANVKQQQYRRLMLSSDQLQSMRADAQPYQYAHGTEHPDESLDGDVSSFGKCMYVCIYAYLCLCMYVSISCDTAQIHSSKIHIHTYTHTHTHTLTYIHILQA